MMSRSQRRLFEGVERERERIIVSLAVAGDGRYEKRVARLDGCCHSPLVATASSGRPALVMGRCRDRLCPFCARCRGRQLAPKLAAIVSRMNAPRFLTLTLREDGKPLGERLDRLFAGFRNLRRHAAWKRRVVGGVYTIEVTRGATGDGWHVHIHALIDGEYFPQEELSAAWNEVTGDSPVVHIRAVHDRARTVRYVVKYVTKPADVGRWSAASIVEFADGMHRRRLLSTFGLFHNFVNDEDADDTPGGLTTAGVSVGRLFWAAGQGCRDAITVLRLAGKAGGFWARALGVQDRSGGGAQRVPLTDDEWSELAQAAERAERWSPPQPTTPRMSRILRERRQHKLFGTTEPPA